MAWSSSSESEEQTPTPLSPVDGCEGTGTFAEFLIARQYGGHDLVPSELLTPTPCGHCRKVEDLRSSRSSMPDTGSRVPDDGRPPLVEQIAFEGNSCFSCVKMIYQKTRWLDQEGGGGCDSGDTPVHHAARSRNLRMLFHFICLVGDEYGQEGAAAVLRKLNGRKETALHEAIKVGNNGMAGLLMWVDPELAQYPEAAQGTSPLYLAVSLRLVHIAQMLYRKSGHGTYLSYSGPDGQNALHVAVLRSSRDCGMIEMLLDWNKDLSKEKDKNGSTSLHFAASAGYQPAYILLLLFGFHFHPLENYAAWHVLDANPFAAYEPDNNGSFPVHIAAFKDRIATLGIVVKRCPGCIGLRDKLGRTFLHIAVLERSFLVVRYACQESIFASIMNAQDNDGNTALHLAAEAGELYISSALLGNLEVLVNLWNNKNQSPLDLAEGKTTTGYSVSDPEIQENMLYKILKIAGGKQGSEQWDHSQESRVAAKKEYDEKQLAKMSDSTKSLGIISPLIASATFSATFAVPAGLKARESINGGTPGLFGTVSFNVFMVAITIAFIYSLLSTIHLVFSGMPSVEFRMRLNHFRFSFRMMMVSLTCLAVAFGSGLYMVLTPLGEITDISIISIMASIVVLFRRLEFTKNIYIITSVVHARRGFWYTLMFLVWGIFERSALDFYFVIIIVGLGNIGAYAAHQKHSGFGL